MRGMCRSEADTALETALHILEALQKAKDAQAIAEAAITKAQTQITDIETSLDSVCTVYIFYYRLGVCISENYCTVMIRSC